MKNVNFSTKQVNTSLKAGSFSKFFLNYSFHSISKLLLVFIFYEVVYKIGIHSFPA